MIHWPDLYLDQMSWRNRADQYARRRLLVDPEGEEAPTGSNCVCLHIEWSGEGLPTSKRQQPDIPPLGRDARFWWKLMTMEMLLISMMKLKMLMMLTITPKMVTLRKQGTSLLRVMESSKESPWDISPRAHNPHFRSPRHRYHSQYLGNLEHSLLEKNLKNGANAMILWLMMMIKKKKKITTV